MCGNPCNSYVIVFNGHKVETSDRIKNNKPFKFTSAYRGYLTGSFLSIFLPGVIGGDIFRIKYCSDLTGMGLKKSGIIVFLERLFGLTALGIIFTLGLLIVGVDAVEKYIPSQNIIILGSIIAAIALISVLFFLKTRYGLSLTGVFKVLTLSVLAQILDVIIAAVVLSVVVPGANPLWMMIAVPLAYVATVLPVSLGGLGVREGVMASVLSLFGVSVSLAVILSFIIYLIKVLTGLLSGMYVFWISPENLYNFKKIKQELAKQDSV